MLRSATSLASRVAHGLATLTSSDSLLLSRNGASQPGLFVEGRVFTAAEPAPHQSVPLSPLEEAGPDCNSKSVMLQNKGCLKAGESTDRQESASTWCNVRSAVHRPLSQDLSACKV